MSVLEIVGESGAERLIQLSATPTLIGRDRRQCQVVFDGSGVSRVHARISALGTQFMLEDCKSRNGTTLNGKKIRNHLSMVMKSQSINTACCFEVMTRTHCWIDRPR